MPVLITGIGQYFFNWTGPMETLFGLIKWYQRPLGEFDGLSGLFNNANYAGSWLNIVWPFCLAAFFRKCKVYKKGIILSILLFVLTAIFLTNSRSSWGVLLINSFIMFSKFQWVIFLPIVFILALIVLFLSPFLITNLKPVIIYFIPKKIWIEFTQLHFDELEVTRQDLWGNAVKTIIKNPIFGKGANSFSENFNFENDVWHGHAHNFPLEIAHSYGIPATIILVGFILSLTILSLKTIWRSSSKIDEEIIFDKAWIAAMFSFLISHTVDITYFDGRISIAAWILLAGMRNIILNHKTTSNLKDEKNLEYK